MDDATPIAKAETSLDAAIAKMDTHDGFAVLRYKGREIIMMTEAKFEEWEDAVDSAAIVNALANPDPEGQRTLQEVADELGIMLPSQRQA